MSGVVVCYDLLGGVPCDNCGLGAPCLYEPDEPWTWASGASWPLAHPKDAPSAPSRGGDKRQ